MKQGVEQPDDAIVLQAQARHPAFADLDRLGASWPATAP
jgi:hypothetical protein